MLLGPFISDLSGCWSRSQTAVVAGWTFTTSTGAQAYKASDRQRKISVLIVARTAAARRRRAGAAVDSFPASPPVPRPRSSIPTTVLTPPPAGSSRPSDRKYRQSLVAPRCSWATGLSKLNSAARSQHSTAQRPRSLAKLTVVSASHVKAVLGVFTEADSPLRRKADSVIRPSAVAFVCTGADCERKRVM